MSREFTVVVERGENGMLIGTAPALPGCHTQGASIEILLERMREAISLCLEEEGDDQDEADLELVGVHRVSV